MTEHPATKMRVLVVIGTSPHGSAALETASRLAGELRAELQGLFVEDVNLIRLAGLPFAREIDSSSGTFRDLNLAAMEQSLRQTAESVRRAIAETADRLSLHWSFRISRGTLKQALRSEDTEADLLVIGRENRPPTRPFSTRYRGPIMMLDDGSESAARVFDVAQRLARKQSETIVALVTCDEPPAGGSSHAATPFYLQRCSLDIMALLQAVRQWQPQLLLIHKSSPLLGDSTLTDLVTRLPCPLAIVR